MADEADDSVRYLDCDYLVVGAGAAGCVLTSRLVRRGMRVVLVEEGPQDAYRSPTVQNPNDWASTSRGWPLSTLVTTAPQKHLAGRHIPVWVGRGCGGGTLVNAALYQRGRREDYLSWPWDIDFIEAGFKSVENELRVEMQYPGEVGRRLVAAVARATGLACVPPLLSSSSANYDASGADGSSRSSGAAAGNGSSSGSGGTDGGSSNASSGAAAGRSADVSSGGSSASGLSAGAGSGGSGGGVSGGGASGGDDDEEAVPWLADSVRSAMHLTTRCGRRLTSWEAFVRPLLAMPNLTVLSGHAVTRVLLAHDADTDGSGSAHSSSGGGSGAEGSGGSGGGGGEQGSGASGGGNDSAGGGVGGRSGGAVPRAVGVEAVIIDESAGSSRKARARGRRVQLRLAGPEAEVILCCGAAFTPQVLMLSGIGPRAHLESLGISVTVDAPAVGTGLRDHVLLPTLSAALLGGSGSGDARTPATHSVQGLADWSLDGSGSGARVQVMLADGEGLPKMAPLLAAWTGPLSRGAGSSGARAAAALRWLVAAAIRALLLLLPPLRGLLRRATCLNLAVMAPASRGAVTLRSADPADAPLVDPAYLSDARDRTALRGAFLAARSARGVAREDKGLSNAGSGAGFQGAGSANSAKKGAGSGGAGGVDLLPGPLYRGAAADADFARWSRDFTLSYFHLCSSCAMGRALGADLRVAGAARLRVADASAAPSLPAAPTQAMCMMLGDRAAALVLAQRGGGRVKDALDAAGAAAARAAGGGGGGGAA